MSKDEALQRIEKVGLVPVLRAESADLAITTADAIIRGGVHIVEVTMTVPGALDVIGALIKAHGSLLLIGAGSVLDPETARVCILAGAQFVVAPSINVNTVEMCHRYGVAVLPGALTPTEIITAWQAGADAVKVFPCSAVGGAKYLKALHGPMPQVKLIPTGGVSLGTAEDFLRAGALALGVGSDLADTNAVAEGRAEAVTKTAREYLAIIARVRAKQP